MATITEAIEKIEKESDSTPETETVRIQAGNELYLVVSKRGPEKICCDNTLNHILNTATSKRHNKHITDDSANCNGMYEAGTLYFISFHDKQVFPYKKEDLHQMLFHEKPLARGIINLLGILITDFAPAAPFDYENKISTMQGLDELPKKQRTVVVGPDIRFLIVSKTDVEYDWKNPLLFGQPKEVAATYAVDLETSKIHKNCANKECAIFTAEYALDKAEALLMQKV